MPNVFDQFDSQAAELSNPFDQFDHLVESPKQQGLSLEPMAKTKINQESDQVRTQFTKEKKGLLDSSLELGGDLWGAFGMGSGQLLSGAGWLFDSETLSQLGDSTTSYWEKTLSDAQRESMGKRFVDDDLSFGDAMTDPRSWAGTIVQSFPAMVTGMGAGALSAKAAIGLGAGTKAATMAGATAGSAVEGTTIAAMVGDETYKTVMNADLEQLQQSPYFQDLIKVDPDVNKARQKTAEKASEAAALPAGVGGAILGVAFNKFVSDAVTGNLSKRITMETLKGGALEAGTEAAQGLLETGSKQYYLNQYANQDYNLAEAANEMVAGAGAGFAMGSAVGGLGALGSNPDNREVPEQNGIDDIRTEPYISGEDQSRQDAINRIVDEDGNIRDNIPTLQPEEDNIPTLEPEEFDLDSELAGNPFDQFDDEPVSAQSDTVARQNENMRQTKVNDDPWLKEFDKRHEQQTQPQTTNDTESSKTGIYRVPVDQIKVDPEQYQFRSKVNKEGVDNRLDGVTKWDDARSGVVTIHRRKDGSMYVADGHHRVDLAKKLKQPDLNARFLDETDGISVEDARLAAAMQNIADGKAEAVDIAKVIKNSSKKVSDVRKEHNLPNNQLVRDGESLSKLNDNVFGMVVNTQISDKDGAAIGSAFEDSKQEAAAAIFQKVKPATEYQRQLLTNEIKAADFAESQGEQGGLFGDDPQEVSLMQDRLKVLDSLRTRLNTDKKLFATLNKNADKATKAGNKIATEANSEITEQSAKSLDLLGRVATTPALNEIVNRAAKRVFDGEQIGTVTKELQKELMNYDKATSKQPSEESSRGQSSKPADQTGQDNRGSEQVSSGDTTRADDQGKRRVREESSREQVIRKGRDDEYGIDVELIQDGENYTIRTSEPNKKDIRVESGTGGLYLGDFILNQEAEFVPSSQIIQAKIGSTNSENSPYKGSRSEMAEAKRLVAEIEFARNQGDMKLVESLETQLYNHVAGIKTTGQPEQDLLSSYTEEELQQQEETRKAKEAEQAKTKKAEEDRIKADAQVNDFSLTGSDRPSDSNPNQNDMFFDSNEEPKQVGNSEKKPEIPTKSDQAKPESDQVSDQAAGQVEDNNTTPMDDWRGDLIKTRDYAKKLIDAGKLNADEAKKVWGAKDKPKLEALIDESIKQEDKKSSVKDKKSSAKTKKTPKQERIERYLNAKVGDIISFSDDIGYAAKGKPYKITQIGKDGSVFIESEKGSGTSISYGEVIGAINAGIESTVVDAGKPKSKLEKLSDSIDSEIDSVAAELAELLKAQLRNTNMGVDPAILALGAKLGALYVSKGVVKFAQYSQAVLKKLSEMGVDPEQVKPMLKEFYAATQAQVSDELFEQMDDMRTVRKFDLESADIDTEGNNNAEYTAGNKNQDSEGNEEQDIESDLFNDGRGTGRQGTAETGKKVGKNEQESSESLGDSGATTTREPSNLALHDDESRMESSNAGSANDLASLPDSTGGLFANEIRIDSTQNIIDAAPSVVKKAKKSKEGQKSGDIDQIRSEMPFLTEGQAEDVSFAENRFSKPDGFGVMFTNGTGTGKTFTGLGIVKRFVNRGKKNVLIVAPKQTIADAWMKAGENFFDLRVSRLEDIKDKGEGIVVTTYANIGQNDAIVSRDWDLVIADESHYLSSDKEGSTTNALKKLKALTLKSGSGRERIYALHSDLVSEMNELYSLAESYSKSDDQQYWYQVDGLEKKAKKIHNQISDMVKAENERIDSLSPEDKPRAVFLSATPFAYDKNIIIGQEFLFDWGDDRGGSGSQGYNHADNYQDFMMTHFGYRMRYGLLTTPDAKVDSGLMERAFNSWLKKEGALSGRTLDSDFDYDRRFILAESVIGKRVDDALNWLRGTHVEKETDERALLRNQLSERIIGDNFKYHARMYFLEALKAKEALPTIRAYVDGGYKVLVMHDFKKGGASNPFRITPPKELEGLYNEFKQEFGSLINDFEFISSPIDLLSDVFPDALIYNGNVSAKNRIELQNQFNSDEPNAPNLMIAQGDAMREGVSIHDTTGKHKRVLIHLGMPVKPTAAIQQEGRIYRTGQASDAIFRYFTIGTNWERYTFASTISQRASTAENLAMGEQARGLKESFIEAYEEAGDWPVGSEDEGKGGKERDRALSNALTPWDMAKSYYFGTKKQGSGRAAKGREGQDYFATPEPLGMKMVQWADIRGGESVLEPSAGHGAIGRWFPENTTNKAIEQSDELASKLSLRFSGDVLTGNFEDHNIVNKYDAIVMNPPYGSGGKTAADHVRKAMKHLRDGGRIVALIPTGPAADKQFDKLLYPDDPKKDTDAKDIYVISDITLPRVTFERAGTSVSTRVLVLEKQTNDDLVANIRQTNRDYSNAETIEELFDRLEHSELPPRVKPIEQEEDTDSDKGSKPEVKKVGSGFETWEAKHTKTNAPLFMAKPSQKLEYDHFKKVSGIAKKHDGYYSKFGKAGFLFNSEEDRQAFIDDLSESDSASFSLSGAGKSYNNVTKAQLKELADEFMNNYNGNVPLEFIIVNKQEEIYGPDNTAERTGTRVGGAYHAKSRKVVLVASSFRDLSTARKTIKHEVLGHYGLNTFTKEDKEAFLRKILETRGEIGYQRLWSKIDKLYESESEIKKAEEFFAFTVEKGDSLFHRLADYLADTIRNLLKKVGLAKSVISRTEIREVAASIAQGIRNGTREQQNFPESDDAQFSQRANREQTQHQARMEAFWNGISHQPLDRMFRLPFDTLGLIDSHGRFKGGVKLHDKAADAIVNWKADENGRFAFVNPVLETARHGLIDRYKLSDEYKSKFREAEALGRSLDMKALDILKTLEEHGLDAGEAAVLQKMLTGETIEARHLDHLAAPIKAAIEELGLFAVEYGIITREQFERNRGAYLHRSYTKHEAQFTGLGKWVLNQQSKSVKRKIAGKSAKGRGLEIKLPMERLLKHVDPEWFGLSKAQPVDMQNLTGRKFIVLENPGVDPRHTDRFDFATAEELAQTRTLERVYWPHDKPMPRKYEAWRNKGTYEVRGGRKGNVVLWRDYTKAERENMGEIVDARYNIAKTFMVISNDIAMGKFFQDVSRNEQWFQNELPPGQSFLTAREAESLSNLSKTDWVHVPDTTISKTAGTKTWGALSGGYVRAEIWRDLVELDKIHNPNSGLLGTWQKLLTQWKLNKTARSPVVHMNNVMSNIMLMDLADVRMTDLVAGLKSYKNKDSIWRDAQEHGAFEGTFANEELRRRVMEPILNELMSQNIEANNSIESRTAGLWSILATAHKHWRTFDSNLVGAYQVEDEIFRMATYMRRLSLGDSPKEAAQIAREQFLDYDIRAPWVNAARKTLLPFISYTYRAAPVLAQAIAYRPWKLAKYSSLAALATAIAYSLSPGDEDEERRTMREDQQGNTWIGTERMLRLGHDEYYDPVFLDIRRWIPAGDIFDINQGSSAIGIPSWLQWGGPLMLGAELFLNKQGFTGREITKETDETSEKVTKITDYLYKSWMPSAAYIPNSHYWDKVGAAINGELDRSGKPIAISEALLSSIGIKVQSHNVKSGYDSQAIQLYIERKLIIEDLKAADRYHDRGAIDKAELNKIKAKSNKKLDVIKAKLRELNGTNVD